MSFYKPSFYWGLFYLLFVIPTDPALGGGVEESASENNIK